MKNLLITLITLIPAIAICQDPMVLDYKWERSPVLHQLSETDQKIPELILKDKTVMEFAFGKSGTLEEYKLHHVIIRVNSDDAINNNNKIYLPYYNKSEMVDQKVRVINSKGKVINLDDDDIKESKDEESESTVKYFALEGVDLGSEIEYYFLIHHESAHFIGTQITLQSSLPKRDVEFTLISPSNLVMATKCYNSLPEPVQDETNKEQNVLTIKMDSIPGLKDEDFSNRDAHLMYIIYKLDENTYTGKDDLINYNDVAESQYDEIYTKPSSSAVKKMKALLKEIDAASLGDEEEQIRAVEEYIKTNYQPIEIYSDNFTDLDEILKVKFANEKGLTILYAQLFTLMGIKHEIVLTSNRYDLKFDPDFEAYNFLDTYLIYFPGIDKHLTPGDNFSRLGYLFAGYTNNYGLYIKPVSAGSYESGVAKVRFIDALPYDKSKDDLYINVDLSKDINNPVYTIHRDQTGYYAESIQLIYPILDADGQKDMREEQINFISEDADISEVELKNAKSEDFGVKPLETDGKFSTPQFVEKAGNQYLFNVGLLIGPQAEMYQEEQRKLEVENDFNRWYHREITFTIPDGYECTNLNDLNMDVFQEKGGERTMTFTCTYTVTGNTVKIVIDEYYKQIIWPVEEYEAYRSVINASADFNKVSLIFQQK